MTVRTGDAERGQLEKLARRGSASVIGAGFSAVSGIVLVVIVTNGFPPVLAGTLFAATSAFLILEAVVLLGTDTGLVRWLPAHLASGRAQDVRCTLVVSLAPVLSLSAVGAATLFVAAPALAPYLVGAEHEAPMVTALRVLALMLPVAAVHDVLLAATRGMGTMRPTVVVENIGRLALQAGAVLGIYLFWAGALSLVLAWSLPYAVALVCSAVWLRLLLRRRAGAATGPARSWRPVFREFWAYTAPRAVARITQTALKRSDIVLVAALSTPTNAALYTAATRFIVFGQLLVQSVQQALAPHLSALFARDEGDAARAVFQAATVWSMVPSWPIYLVTAGFAPTLMTIFGPGYEQASGVVVILSLTMLFATACGPVDSVLLMAGRSWLSLANSTVALVINLGLNFLLIPRNGIEGAAAAWSVAILVRNLLPLLQVRHYLHMWPGTTASGYVAAGALLCFGVISAVTQLAALPTLIAAVFVLLGGVAYLTGIWLLRGPLQLDAFRAGFARRRGRGLRAVHQCR